ncbi:MAG: HDOD domain-containing protein [Desulfobacteraceae bacterium]|nr:HDOD domain-containing protein [Desulfobacteraceae bacterium]
MISRNRTFERIRQSGNLPQLPQVVVKLIEACNNDETDIRDLSQIISADPGLTSRLMEIIGSAYLNIPKAPDTIETAVVYLGMDTIKNIAISASAMHVFKLSTISSEFDIATFWNHSYKCAVLAKNISMELKLSQPDEAFLAGLLHEIGKLLLAQNFPGEYLEILADQGDEKDRIAAEKERFDTTTEEISSWLFDQWRLNPLMADAVLYVNASPGEIANALDLVKIVFVSNRLADKGADDPAVLELSGIEQSRLADMLTKAGEEADAMARSLGIPTPDATGVLVPANDALTRKIKEIALFHGTLQNLLNAEEIDSVLSITENGIKILFRIPRIFYFLYDKEKNLLTGRCSPRDKHHRILGTIAIPMSNTSSLLTASLQNNRILNSLAANNTSPAISDIQLMRLLETDGLCCIPMKAVDSPVGVIVLGIDQAHKNILLENSSLLKLFSRQTALCLKALNHRKESASILQNERMQAFTAITRKIVHEVNNPIGIITNYLTLLSMKLPDKHPAQSELKVVSEEIDRISGLIRKLSDFSKPDIAEFKSVDIDKLYSAVLDIIKKSLLLPRGIEATLVAAPDIPPITTDKNGLKQVLINLVKNAAEAMDKGGEININIRFVPGSSKILIDEKRKTPGSIEITIRDNGPGIPDTIREKLFEPYNSTKGANNSGLGLSIVHSIIRSLSGTITCKSGSTEGTCFTILLPVTSPKPVLHQVIDDEPIHQH